MWSSSAMDTSNPREITSALPASGMGMGYLMEDRLMGVDTYCNCANYELLYLFLKLLCISFVRRLRLDYRAVRRGAGGAWARVTPTAIDHRMDLGGDLCGAGGRPYLRAGLTLRAGLRSARSYSARPRTYFSDRTVLSNGSTYRCRRRVTLLRVIPSDHLGVWSHERSRLGSEFLSDTGAQRAPRELSHSKLTDLVQLGRREQKWYTTRRGDTLVYNRDRPTQARRRGQAQCAGAAFVPFVLSISPHRPFSLVRTVVAHPCLKPDETGY
ncbi:hypothetical protein EVAR_67671_1 [Eumeta japonica]|uniref:Uncharacterized protein n=1 Tax=Eumeta variegata TaxID=151549 RepID=A0A4C1Z9S5_EUMVA|nr:hypothetical protein EVAR_67671_1 [Eumeta japonica]